MKRNFAVAAGSILIMIAGFISVSALNVNDVVSNVNIKDANDKPAQIPFLGQKVLTIVYCDTDTSDISDPISDALKAKNFPEAKQKGIGVANLKNSAAPNFLIRKIIQKKIAKYNSTILTDDSLILPAAWGLGNVDDKSVVMIIGADKKVKFIKYFTKNNKPTQADIDACVNLMASLTK